MQEIEKTLLPFLREIVRARQYDDERHRRRTAWLRSWRGAVVIGAGITTMLAFLVSIGLTIATHLK